MMVTHREILAIALPMVLSNLSLPLVGMTDTAVMGHLPDVRYIGAVAVASSLFAFLFVIFNFLRMGATGRVAQYFGQGDDAGVGRVLIQGLILAAGLGALLVLFQWPLARFGFDIMGAGAEVTAEAQRYFTIRIWAAPFVLANYVLVGWFLGLQNARFPLLLTLLNNLTNIGLDFGFVLGLGMTVDGVAWATVISEVLAFVVGLYLALGAGKGLYFIRLNHRLFPAGEFRATMRMNRDLLIRTVSLMMVFTWFTAQGAREGETTLAANAILLNFFVFMAFGLDGFAHAAEALVGKSLGQGQRRYFLSTLKKTAQWSVLMAVIFSGFFFLFGTGMIHLLTSLHDVRQAAEIYLPWIILMSLVAVWPFWLDGVFIGGTWSEEMRNSMLVSVFGFFLTWYLLADSGNHGLWFSLVLFFAYRAVTLGFSLKHHMAFG
ncbi:MAG TPA: MATE family efflux transporter [Gammaproteobacteria bacterium]|nr:MATE family efflux transporter [Gammaproteobacteria bacterium]